MEFGPNSAVPTCTRRSHRAFQPTSSFPTPATLSSGGHSVIVIMGLIETLFILIFITELIAVIGKTVLADLVRGLLGIAELS